ncbi:MAG: TonB-dependent receptor plug domain-containing protein, partial [Caulobacteraceae bacterium]
MSVRSRLLTTTVFVSTFATLSLSGPAWAQDAMAQNQAGQAAPTSDAPAQPLSSAPDAAPNAVAEVVVTGSLIRQPNLTSTSPLTVVNSEEFKLQGATNVEDVLNSLPSVVASQSEGVGNGATGTATVDLRGLGTNRNLVLIDGKRVGTSDPGDSGAVDLNIIPAALIQRVDVVTGGASAIYGSDAISGVVNFVLQHDFQGVRIDGNFTDFEHGNSDKTAQAAETAHDYNAPSDTFTGGAREDATVIVGVNAPDDKGNVTGYFGYRHIQPVSQGKYDYGACALAESGSGYACSGSGTTTSARFITSTGADYYLDPKTNGLRSYDSATDAYNYGPSNYYQREDTRYTGGFFGHYQVAPKLDLYSDFMFMQDSSTAQLAPSGLFGQTFTVPCSNSELTAAELSTLCNGSTSGSTTLNITRRNVEGGDREEILKHTEFREVIGARGDLDNVWHYDVSAQYFQATMSDEQTGDFSLTKAQAALSGCSSVYTSLAATTGCVPYNIFSTGGVTQAALDYLETDAFQTSTTTQQVVNATISGDLGKYGITSPWA